MRTSKDDNITHLIWARYLPGMIIWKAGLYQTPVLNIPDELFEQLFDRIELMAKKYQSTSNLLSHPVIPTIINFVNTTTPEVTALMSELTQLL